MNEYIVVAGGTDLDTYDDLAVSLNYQIDDILDPTKRSTSFSKTIELPGTPKNNKFFKQIFDVNIDNINFNPALRIPGSIRVGDNEVLTGSLQLLKINNDQGAISYEVAIAGDLKSIISSFQEYSLNSLDLSEWDHYRNTDEVIQSWTYRVKHYGQYQQYGGPGQGYVYPYIVNGNSTDIYDRVELYDLYPAPYVKTVWDKLFEFTGYTYTSKFLNSEYFKKLILPYTGDSLQIDEEDKEERSLAVGLTDDRIMIAVEQTPGSSWYNNSTNGYYIGLDRKTGEVDDDGTPLEFKDDSFQWNNYGTFTCDKMGQYDIRFDGKLFARHRDPSGNFSVEFNGGNYEYLYRLKLRRANGAMMTLDSSHDPNDPNDLYGTQLFQPSSGVHGSPWYDTGKMLNFLLSAQGVFLNPGDKVYVEFGFRYPNAVKWKGIQERPKTSMWLKRSHNGSFSKLLVTPSSDVSMGGEKIKLSNMMPDIKMKDFFLDIVKMFNLVIADDPTKPGNLIIEPRDDYFKGTQRVKDWSMILDRQSTVNIIPMSELDARIYHLKYSLDDDFYNKSYLEEFKEEYGELKLSVVNDFSLKTNKLEIGFAPTVNAQQFINDRVAPFFAEKTDTAFKPKRVKPRILFYNGPVPCEEYWLTESAVVPKTAGIKLTSYPYAGMWEHPIEGIYDLSFGPQISNYWDFDQAPTGNLYEMFHKSTINNITDINARMMEATFKLTPRDIADFDFRDVIFIDGSYWRVNKIKDWNPVGADSLTKVLLYKILDYQNVTPHRIEIPTSNNDCPEDIVAVIGKQFAQGASLDSVTKRPNSPYYKSRSGKPLTKDCCKTLKGHWKDGICYARRIIPGDTGVIIDRPIGAVAVKDLAQLAKEGILIGKSTGRVPVSRKDGPISLKVDNNSVNRIGQLVIGKGNYIGPDTDVKLILGDNNTVAPNVTDTIVIGSGIYVNQSGSIYIGDTIINGDGVKSAVPYTIDAGLDTVINPFKTNYIDIIDGTLDSLKNPGGDSKTRPLIDLNLGETGGE